MSNRYTTTGQAGVPGTQPVGTTQPAATNLTGAGYGNGVPAGRAGIHSGANTTASTGAPLHTSSLLNKLDPRVDSDMDGSRNMGATQTQGQTAHTLTGGTSGYGTGVRAGGVPAGAAGAGVGAGVPAGAAGAGVVSGAHTGVPGAGVGFKQTPGTGTATRTAGPHNSNLLNKLDPRVDSDMDGSQTIGGNRTYV